MNVLVYAHVPRTFPPLTGYGRHAVEVVHRLGERRDVRIDVLASAEFVSPNGQLDLRSPFHQYRVCPFRLSERRAEYLWRLIGQPRLDRHATGADVVYSPFETYLPLRSRPWVVTLHDVMAFERELPWSRTWKHRLFRAKWSFWVPAALRSAERVLTSSEFSKQRMVDLLSVDPAKVLVVGNGVDGRFHAAADLDTATLARPCPEPYLAVVGGLVPHKGGDVVLRVAETLRRMGSVIRIIVAGRSAPHLADEANRHPNVTLLGRIPDEDLIPFLRGSLALLFPSWYEGFGMPPLEAMATGVPAIVSDRASVPEVVGQSAIVVPPERPEEMAEWAVRLDRDTDVRERWVQLGRARSKQYTWERTAELVHSALLACI